MRQRLQWIVPLLCLLLLVGLVPARGYAEDDTIVISVEDESETETVSIDELNGEMDSVFDVDQLWPEEEREDLRSSAANMLG